MDLRKRIVIIAGVVIGILAIILVAIFVFRREPAPLVPGAVVPEEEARQPSGVAPPLPTPAVPIPVEDLGERYVRQLAGIFVERFGSYSNQNGNKHLDDAAALATDRMVAWIRTQAIVAGQVYAGKTTRVVASKIESYSETAASVHVDVQEETTGAVGASPTYRSGRVELAKVAGEWKVSGLFWE